MLKAELERIEGDVCDISRRIREVEPEYFIVYNRRLGRYELHDGLCGVTFACVLPFDELDARSLRYARRMRVERINRLLEELDRENGMTERA